MDLLHSALTLAAKGFYVFPIVPGKKAPPVFKGWQDQATRDPETIGIWWNDNPDYNVGIFTGRFGENEALLAIDVDNKGDKKGDQEILRLELEGKEFPRTFLQRTPTGGKHLIYRIKAPVRQGVNVLGRGLDLRSRGGFLTSFGSRTSRGTYTIVDCDLAVAPDWLVSDCGYSSERKAPKSREIDGRVDTVRAQSRAIEYLEAHAPLSIEGDGGDQTAFKVAARVKDLGVSVKECFELLCTHWNDRCEPPWDEEELKQKVENAYAYGEEPPGVSAPETEFQPIPETADVLSPISKINSEYAYIGGSKGFILWETKDEENKYSLECIDVPTFHQNLCSKTMDFGGKPVPTTRIWLKHPDRRSYSGLCFTPGKTPPPPFYNLWKGFTVQPLDSKPTRDEQASLDAFLEHALENVCDNNPKLFKWLIGYFAHLIQKPWELPSVALVFHGKKGVGKNALVERIGYLLGSHFTVVSNRRYLTGNFNSFIENKLMLVLDEAFWSGDKAGEGVLKDIITGTYHQIERKGQEPYRMKNCLRVVILGNEKWMVPATEDERRFAVFTLGDKRLQDKQFFKDMRLRMEAGGSRLLLKYLQEFDLSDVDVSDAPKTKGLANQKIESLNKVQEWWYQNLREGCVQGSDFGGEWPQDMEKERLRSAFHRYAKDHGSGKFIANPTTFGVQLLEVCPSLKDIRKRIEASRLWFYEFPSLKECRNLWDIYLKHPTEWPPD